MKLLITLAIFCLLGQTLATAAALTNALGTAGAANDCTSVLRANIATCETVDESSGASQKCCKLTFGTAPTYGGVAVGPHATAGTDAGATVFCYKKGTYIVGLGTADGSSAASLAIEAGGFARDQAGDGGVRQLHARRPRQGVGRDARDLGVHRLQGRAPHKVRDRAARRLRRHRAEVRVRRA